MSKHDERCPQCGRFVEGDEIATGYYCFIGPEEDRVLRTFCNENCCNNYLCRPDEAGA